MTSTEYCVAETYKLIDCGAPSDVILDLITARISLNEAREKLQLPPLESDDAKRLFAVDPNSVRYALTDAGFREACDRWVNDKAHRLGSLPDYLREVFPDRFQNLIRELDSISPKGTTFRPSA